MARRACSASGAVGAQADRRTAFGGEHHHAHDALAVHLEVVADDRDLAWNFAASFTISAAGRAWRPFLFRSQPCVPTSADHRERSEEERRSRGPARQPSMRPCSRRGERGSRRPRRAPALASTAPIRRAGADDARAASGSATPATTPSPRAPGTPARRSTGFASAPATRIPCVQPTCSPQTAARSARRCTAPGKQHDGHRPAPSPKASERDERAEWQPPRPHQPIADAARAVRTARCESARSARAASPSSSARASAPTATTARYGCALK